MKQTKRPSRQEIRARIVDAEAAQEVEELMVTPVKDLPGTDDVDRLLSTEEIQKRERLRNWKSRLDALRIGHGSQDYNLLVGTPFHITPREYEQLRRHGLLYGQMHHTANKLYADSLHKPNIVTLLVEGSMIGKAVAAQRELYERKGGVRLPVFMRADMLSLDKTVELNIPGAGLGMMHAIEKITLNKSTFGEGLAKGFAQGLKQLTGKENPRVALPIHSEKSRAAVKYFAKALDSLGVQTIVYGKNIPDPSEMDVLLRFGMNYAVTQEGWYETWNAYLNGKLEIEPPPTSIYDTKIAGLLAFHPETRSAFPGEIREMFPETWLAEPDGSITMAKDSGEPELKIEQIPNQPEGKRRYVLKYAGSRGSLAAGGKAVYQLDGKRKGKDGAEDLVHRALEDYRTKSEPWIIQRRLRVDHDVVYLDSEDCLREERMRARIMPVYKIWQGQPEIIGGSALFSHKWKVHGQPDSVHCAIEVS